MKSPQINLETVKELLKKLSFVKKNPAVLAPIITLLVAALLFIPTTLLSAKLKRTINEQSVKTATDIDKLVKDVNEAGQAEAMEEYVEACKQDMTQIETLMKQMTMRELLTYQVFLDPNETSPLLYEPVRREYLAGVDAMLVRIGASTPPADGEMEAALKQAPRRSLYGGARSIGMGYGGGYGGGGGKGGIAAIYAQLPSMERKIIDKLCEDKARGVRVYASPADLDGYSFWTDWKFEDKDTSLRQAWTWQMGYWILEDVIDTVEAMNRDTSSVLEAPVKRIMSASFTTSSQSGRKVGGRRGKSKRQLSNAKTMPVYVINQDTAIAAPPCTGRFCNADLDVMHFSISVVVDADQVVPFIQELCSAKTHKFYGWDGKGDEQTFKHNQITALETNVTPVDLEDVDHSTFRYGPGVVLTLDLICEYIFPRAGYDEIKPQLVKNDIAGTELAQ